MQNETVSGPENRSMRGVPEIRVCIVCSAEFSILRGESRKTCSQTCRATAMSNKLVKMRASGRHRATWIKGGKEALIIKAAGGGKESGELIEATGWSRFDYLGDSDRKHQAKVNGTPVFDIKAEDYEPFAKEYVPRQRYGGERAGSIAKFDDKKCLAIHRLHEERSEYLARAV